MDNEEIKNSIIERFNSLQPEIQEAIMNLDYENNLSEIGKKYNLNIEQMEEFELNTTLVMLGQTHPDEYGDGLMEDLHLSKEKTEKIVLEVKEKILNSIIFLLKKNFEDDNLAEAELEKEITINKGVGEVITEDEVPKPPYVISSKEQVVSSKGNQSSMQEVVSSKEENTIQNTSKSAFEEKLKGPTVSEHTVSDYSTPKKNTLPPVSEDKKTPSQDPYREAF